MDSYSFEPNTDFQLPRNVLLQPRAHTTPETGAQFSSGATGLMGCGLEPALCRGSAFHERFIPVKFYTKIFA